MSESSEISKEKLDKRILIIFLIIFTEVLGFSMVAPVIPFLALSLGLNVLQIGLILSIFSLCQFFASPVTGKLSDRYGRKPLLIVSQISTLIGFILLGLANNVWILILARLVDGLLGSNMTVSQAYISDVTEPKNRTKVYGYSSAVFGAALIFGPLIGGTLSTISYSTPMFFAALVCLVSILLVVIFLPESLTIKEEKVRITFNDIFPIDDAKRFFKDSKIRKLLIIFFLYSFGFMLFISTYALFAEMQINVTALEVGFFMAWIGILRVFFQTVLISPLQKTFDENKVLKIGIISMITAFTILIFTTTFLFAFIPLVFIAFGTGICRPVLTSKLANSVEREETGSLLGVNNALTSIAMIITPILGGIILYYLSSQTLPVISASFFVMIFIILLFTVSEKDSFQENIT
ncbi:MAG: MFS transporter [Promethearchaeota archaeon]|nr:MAG: MFS transporter [Candidatus Lokiarchaeota archaeon]